jgi:hypothetical protein
MSKKDFTGGLNTLLGDQPTPAKQGRPKVANKIITKSSQEGTKEDETRATFIVKEMLLEKLKAMAYWERTLIKDIVDKALHNTISQYENKNGIIKPIPKKS